MLFRNAPHLVHRRDFVVPAYRWLDLPFYGIGLKLYDLLAGRSNLGGSRWIGPAEVVRADPDDRRPRAARRDRLHRRAVRRRPAGDHPGPDVRRPGRARRSITRRSSDSRSAAGGSPRSPPATTRPARSSTIEARVVINATGVYRRRGPPARRSRHGRLAPADAQPGGAPGPRPLVPPRRELRCWSRAPTTAACSSRSPGTTGSWSGRPIRRSPSRPSSRARGGEEIAYLLDHVARYLAKTSASRRRPQHVRRPPAAAPRP